MKFKIKFFKNTINKHLYVKVMYLLQHKINFITFLPSSIYTDNFYRSIKNTIKEYNLINRTTGLTITRTSQILNVTRASQIINDEYLMSQDISYLKDFLVVSFEYPMTAYDYNDILVNFKIYHIIDKNDDNIFKFTMPLKYCSCFIEHILAKNRQISPYRMSYTIEKFPMTSRRFLLKDEIDD